MFPGFSINLIVTADVVENNGLAFNLIDNSNISIYRKRPIIPFRPGKLVIPQFRVSPILDEKPKTFIKLCSELVLTKDTFVKIFKELSVLNYFHNRGFLRIPQGY